MFLLYANEEVLKKQVGVSPKPQKVLQRLQDQGGIWTDKGWVFSGFACVNLESLNLSELPLIAEVGGGLLCGYNELTSLKGCPEQVKGTFWCNNNRLTSLEHGPSKVTGYYNCWYNQLKTLKGAPTVIQDAFSCNNNQLTSLEYGPASVKGFYNCDSNKLKTLKGAPSQASAFFSCEDNHLTSLKQAPLLGMNRTLHCKDNYLLPSAIEEFLKRYSIPLRQAPLIRHIPQKDPSELPIIPIEEPLKAQENPYGDLHPSEIKWNSIGSTESRGFPVWNGVPKKTLEPVVSKEKELVETCKTQGDLLGIQEDQKVETKQFVFRKNLSQKQKEHFNKIFLELEKASIIVNATEFKL